MIPRPGTALRSALAAFALVTGCASTAPAVREPLAAEGRFALRDPRQGASELVLSRRQGRTLDQAMTALRRNELAKAEKLFTSESASPFRLGVVYVALEAGRLDEARQRLDDLMRNRPELPAALEARADLLAVSGDLRSALDDYRATQRLLPGDERVKTRVEEIRNELISERTSEADDALEKGDLVAARRAALAIVELDPTAPTGYQILANAAEVGGQLEDAYVWAVKARAHEPTDAEWTEVVADLAMKTRRFSEAVALFDELAAREPSFRSRAEQARLEFEIQNLPDHAQKAARSSRLTRAQFAVLLWGLVPEIRELSGPQVTEVAVDVVDRTDRAQLLRAVSLGFFSVSKETHRMGAELPVTRAELAALLKRLASLLASGPLPECLAAESPASSLVGCGILTESASRLVNGREAVRAIQKAARIGREGGTR